MRGITEFIRTHRGCISAAIVLALLGGALAAILYFNSPAGGDPEPVLVVVPKGCTALTAGALLKVNGLVRSPSGFALIARLTGSADKIKPGAYLFSRRMSARQMLDKLVRGEVAAVWVTIPEGFTVRQIAERLAERKLVDPDELVALGLAGAKDFGRILDIPAQGVEGYLFPDTYLIPLKTNARDVIAQMLAAFERKVAEPLDGEIAQVAADGSSESKAAALHRILTVASMIEREAKVSQDRPLVSAVIWNRLRLGMRLEIDATVQYSHGRHRSRLYYRDLAVDSPYNTYLHDGLPPGPISNPGLSSIDAALHPAKVDYLYYVARPDGSHVFSRTLEEHNAAKSGG